MTEKTEEEIKITAELTSDPTICKFIVDRTLLESWTLIFRNAEESLASPLIDALFAVQGVEVVRVAGKNVTVTKKTDTPWPQFAAEIGKTIRATLQSGATPISDAALNAVKDAPDENLESVIVELFETHINPALASHGGFVRLARIEDRDVYLEMGGGCQGCASSQATLRDGIEQAVRQVAPQVRSIVDVTNHAAGENPYYS